MSELQVPVTPDYHPGLHYGKVFTSYFAVQNRVQARLPDNRQWVAAVQYFPKFVDRGRYRWLRLLAPSRELLARAKAERIPFQDYAGRYLEELTSNYDSMSLVQDLLDLLLIKRLDIVLFCYEKDATKCHRQVLKTLIVDTCAGQVGEQPELFDGGEIS